MYVKTPNHDLINRDLVFLFLKIFYFLRFWEFFQIVCVVA